MIGAAVLPPPNMLGSPQRYSRWRNGQDAALARILAARDHGVRFIVANLPTGVGKSLVYMTLGRLTGEPMIALTATRALQDQLADPVRGFPDISVDVRGMQNYPCPVQIETHAPFHERNCDSGPCLDGLRCVYREAGCPYYDRLRLANRSRIDVGNYALWFVQKGKELPRSRSMLVLDEAHDAPDILSDFLTVRLSPSELQGAGLPPDPLDLEQWRTWAKAQQQVLVAMMLTTPPGRGLRAIRRLLDKVSAIAGMKGEWIVQLEDDEGFGFYPLWPAPYAEEMLFQGIKTVVLLSATIRPKTLSYLGLAPGTYDYVEYPSPFPVANRPVYIIPTIKLTHRSTHDEIAHWVRRQDQIIAPRMGLKGIIHTVSYERARQIRDLSEHRGRMMLHTPRTTRDVVREFRERKDGAILVSPSVGTGFDFPYELASWQIIAKLPFPDSRSPVVKARQKSDPEYGNYVTMAALQQYVGRIVRAEDDRGETFIVDDNIRWFISRNKHLASRWFLDALVWMDSVPPLPAGWPSKAA